MAWCRRSGVETAHTHILYTDIDCLLCSSFNALHPFLREPDVIARAKDCLQRIHTLCVLRHGDVGVPRHHPEMKSVNARFFLAGYMIAYRPTHVFTQMGARDVTVLNASTALMAAFERILQRCLHAEGFQGVPHELTQDFSRLLFGYMIAFREWKQVSDPNNLSRSLGRALVLMDNARVDLLVESKDSAPTQQTQAVLDEIDKQSLRLTKRLKGLVGAEAALQMARAARCGSIRPGDRIPFE
jgi:hypothetical protein